MNGGPQEDMERAKAASALWELLTWLRGVHYGPYCRALPMPVVGITN